MSHFLSRKGETCCYFIRSLTKDQTYVGVTGNFRKRLAQHCGDEDGGARETTQEGDRWTPLCIVTGFPAEFMAEQFEAAIHARMNKQRIEGKIGNKKSGQKIVTTSNEVLGILRDVISEDKWSPHNSRVALTVNWTSSEWIDTNVTGLASHVSVSTECL
jgi:predicted GIY-YIG superfamily endonuclease